MSTPKDGEYIYTEEQIVALFDLFQLLKKINNVPKPLDVEESITPFYNWLESMFETQEVEG